MAKSLLEVLRDVSLDPTEQAAFSADPSGYLAQYGYDDVQPDDISEAFGLVADTLPPELAQTVAESQAAGQFSEQDLGDEGLAGNDAPTFGAGYETAGGDGADGGEAVGDAVDFGDDPDFGDDLAFGEGSGGEHADDESSEALDPDTFGDDAVQDAGGVGDGIGADDSFGEPAEAGYGEDDDGFDDTFGTGEPGFEDSPGDVDDIGSF